MAFYTIFFYLRRRFSFSAGELRESIGDVGINVAFICLQAPESWDVHSVLPSHLNWDTHPSFCLSSNPGFQRLDTSLTAEGEEKEEMGSGQKLSAMQLYA